MHWASSELMTLGTQSRSRRRHALSGAVTLVAVALIVADVGISLLKVIYQLKHVAWTLGAVIVGSTRFPVRRGRFPEVLSSVNANLTPVQSMAEQV